MPVSSRGDVASDTPANLESTFAPNLSSQLANVSTPMDDFDPLASFSGTSDQYETAIGDPTDIYGSAASSASAFGLGGINLGSLLTGAEGIGSSLVGAFVTNPANATTAEGQQLATAQIQTAETSQIFSYLLLGLGIFLVFGLISKR